MARGHRRWPRTVPDRGPTTAWASGPPRPPRSMRRYASGSCSERQTTPRWKSARTLARASVLGTSALPFRPVSTDAERNRCPGCSTLTSSTTPSSERSCWQPERSSRSVSTGASPRHPSGWRSRPSTRCRTRTTPRRCGRGRRRPRSGMRFAQWCSRRWSSTSASSRSSPTKQTARTATEWWSHQTYGMLDAYISSGQRARAAAWNRSPTIFGKSGATRSADPGVAAARRVRIARATPSFTNRTSAAPNGRTVRRAGGAPELVRLDEGPARGLPRGVVAVEHREPPATSPAPGLVALHETARPSPPPCWFIVLRVNGDQHLVDVGRVDAGGTLRSPG